ncbi:hypothetical protein ACFP9V_05950 [Deinococcus radiopugnans]|uniref:hypothetical protein n=1 Tax=Deinococcus radiopugnans TaxID=57497 RepID=UPI003608509B
MTTSQAETQRIADAPTARALRQNVTFLGLFTGPRSPSEITASAGMAANLAHHHARRLASLGLLLEVRREGAGCFINWRRGNFGCPGRCCHPPIQRVERR